jgi:type I restriction enzyme S subunit
MPDVILNKDWDIKRLDELGFVGRGKSKHRPRDAAHLYGGVYPFIQTADVKHSNLYISNYSQTYSDAGLAQSKLWKTGTLCITIAANIADTAILGIDACFPDSVIGFIADEKKADTIYVKYLFNILQSQYKRFTQGAAQDNLSQEKLLSMRFSVPPLHLQNKIASILSAYDDLIENNLRRIELLENAARLIYKEWFVKLNFPGREHTKIVDGVPEGWACSILEDLLVLQRGFDLPTQNRVDGSVPIYASTGINGYHNEAKVKGPGIITGRSGTIGVVTFAPADFWPLNTSLWVREYKGISVYYAFFLLEALELKNYNGGASVPTLDRKVVHRIDVLRPSKTLLGLFDDTVVPIFKQVDILKKQVNKLRQARDLLLPKLMSGEIAV